MRKKHNAFELKKKVIKHYGGKCACCGEDHFIFLTIDHIHGGGGKHREEILGEFTKKEKEIYHNGELFYLWLIRHKYPKGFQVLCANCNMAKGQSDKKYCPIHHPELY